MPHDVMELDEVDLAGWVEGSVLKLATVRLAEPAFKAVRGVSRHVSRRLLPVDTLVAFPTTVLP